ncbi:ion transporter [Haladaptatus cibarius]|uniref:ion transporter n=1 Tax=Haladaptatus cibarius TaxID=453847 RepID=UPI000678B818|nr:ion transporter [Haladaptatus cibarius]
MYRRTRRRVNQLFQVGAGGRIGQYIDSFILALIVANVASVILETVEPLYAAYQTEFYLFELASVVIFSIEYFGRLWAATEHPEYQHPIWGRLRYATSSFMIIDLLAILPFFLGVFFDLRFLRMFRLLRFLRLFKLARYSRSMRLFVTVITDKKEDFLVASSVGGILLLFSSSLMYFVEHEAQPEVFSSILAAMWWGVVTLTTVGYGDVHPVTPLGKLLGAVVAVIGIGLFALPASILASGFVEESQHETKYACPHCGEHVSEHDLHELE